MFERVAFINGTKYVNQREAIKKTQGLAASPLLNIIGHDPKLSIPLLQRIYNENLEVIQGLKEEVKSAGTTDIWFAVGVGISVFISCSILLILVPRRRRDAREIQQVVDKFQMTEDGHTSKGGVVNTVNV